MNNQEFPFAVVAALKRELAPLRRQVHRNLVLIETGEGTENAERRVRSWLQHRKVRAVFGIGFAGALSPSLHVGDLVVARDGHEAWQAPPSPELLSAAAQVRVAPLTIRFGTIITADEIVCEAKGKRALALTLAANDIGCVDMESSAVAQVCAEHRLPFLIVRCILDELDEDLPLDFNRCRNPDGRVSSTKVLKAALLHPSSLKGLWELRRRSRWCAERLALFIQQLLLFCDLGRTGTRWRDKGEGGA